MLWWANAVTSKDHLYFSGSEFFNFPSLRKESDRLKGGFSTPGRITYRWLKGQLWKINNRLRMSFGPRGRQSFHIKTMHSLDTIIRRHSEIALAVQKLNWKRSEWITKPPHIVFGLHNTVFPCFDCLSIISYIYRWRIAFAALVGLIERRYDEYTTGVCVFVEQMKDQSAVDEGVQNTCKTRIYSNSSCHRLVFSNYYYR